MPSSRAISESERGLRAARRSSTASVAFTPAEVDGGRSAAARTGVVPEDFTAAITREPNRYGNRNPHAERALTSREATCDKAAIGVESKSTSRTVGPDSGTVRDRDRSRPAWVQAEQEGRNGSRDP